MSANLIRKSAFADLVGVTPAAVTKATRVGGILHAAMLGKKLDTTHPAAVAYAAEHKPKVTISIDDGPPIPLEDFNEDHGVPPVIGVNKPTGHTAKNLSKKAGKYEEGSFTVPEYIGDLADMTLRDLIMQFGTDVRFVDWLKATKEIEMINEKRLKNAESEGVLVSRHLVKVGIIDPLESAHIKLLTDGVKTIARRTVALHESGSDLPEIESFISDQVSSFIKPVKAKVKRALKNV